MTKWMQGFALIALSVALAGCVADMRGGRLGGGWERLGSQQVGPGADRDSFPIPPDVGSLREIMIEARGGPVEIRDMVITFDNGETYRPNYPPVLEERDYVINLPGNRRRIKQIDFTYAPARNQTGVSLAVYGR